MVGADERILLCLRRLAGVLREMRGRCGGQTGGGGCVS